jgi:AraC-like DNA-binding protein
VEHRHAADLVQRALLMLHPGAERERRLSETEDSITDVALATGFSHAQHFSTSFRKATGLTPSSFRQRRE